MITDRTMEQVEMFSALAVYLHRTIHEIVITDVPEDQQAQVLANLPVPLDVERAVFSSFNTLKSIAPPTGYKPVTYKKLFRVLEKIFKEAGYIPPEGTYKC